MKAKLIQLEILNSSIRMALAMYTATKDKKYIAAAKLSQEKFSRINNEILNQEVTQTVYIKH